MATKQKRTSTKHTKVTKGKSDRAIVYIIGDSPLIEEYAELCTARGYDISHGKTISSKTSVGIELTIDYKEQKKKNLIQLDKALPATAPILSSSVTITATEQSAWITNKHRLVGISALPAFTSHTIVEAAPTIHTPTETMEVVLRFYQSLGKEIEIVQDRVGMVLPRILCQLVNEATFVVQEDVATPQDIDTAMKLGTNYPLGPIEWGNKIGFQHVYSVLNAIENDLHEERYRISPLLKMLAQTGEWWKKR